MISWSSRVESQPCRGWRTSQVLGWRDACQPVFSSLSPILRKTSSLSSPVPNPQLLTASCPNAQCRPRASPPGVPWSHGRGLLPPSPPLSPQGRGRLPFPLLQNPGHKLPPALALCAYSLPHSKNSEMLGFRPGFSLSLLTAGDESWKGKRNEGLHQASKPVS